MMYQSSLKISVGAAALVASTMVWIACSSSTPTSVSGGQDGGPPSSSSGGSSGGGNSSGSVSGSSSGGASGSSSGTASGSGSGTAGGSSSGGTTSTSCPQTACPSGETCCADIATEGTTCGSCSAANVVGCTGSADCAGSTDGGTECCATAILNKGLDGGNSFPHGCSVTSITSWCGQCNNAPLALGSPPLTCQTDGDASIEQVHVCSTPSDCASEPTNKLCCPVFSYNICLSSLLAGIGGVSCQDGG